VRQEGGECHNNRGTKNYMKIQKKERNQVVHGFRSKHIERHELSYVAYQVKIRLNRILA